MESEKIVSVIDPIPAPPGAIADVAVGVRNANAPSRPDIPSHCRSPLRYPGGKNRAVKRIVPLIPPNTRRLCSPFVGGASIELACAAMGIEVRGYDVFTPLVDFWQYVLNEPRKLADRVEYYHPLQKRRFYELQREYMSLTDRLERAAVFYTLNRSSFSGTTLSGGMSPDHPRFTHTAIERLRRFVAQRITIERADFRQSITENADAFLYLDPPYLNGQKLYGMRGDTHEGFNHHSLRELLGGRDGWILSYNDCPTVRAWYSDYQILKADWQYGMNASKESSEVVVLSHDLAV